MNSYLQQEIEAAKRRKAAIRGAERILAQAFREASLEELRASQLRVRRAVVREVLRRAR